MSEVSAVRFSGSTRAAAFAVAVAGFVGSMTGVAWAPKNLSIHVIEADCQVGSGSGDFLGSVTLTGFALDGSQLTGTATVAGTCTIGSAKTVVPEGTRTSVPVSIQELSCDELRLTFGADVSIAAPAMTIDTGGMQLSVFPGTRGAEARFCAAERLAATRSVTEMLTPLSQLFFQ
ncbi:MAG TPA: hypothetical protein VHN37_10600 [Actinomycetota bacterium]|nr:hypothetical protein [Actinomycetota bacterium]